MTNDNSAVKDIVLKEGYEILNLSSDQIFTFAEGLPGFEHITQYCILAKEDEAPFVHLTALGGYNIEFIVVNPWLVMPDYKPQISSDDLAFVEAASENDLLTICIVVVKEKFVESTVNLSAPIIVNSKNGKAKQIIVRNFKDYSSQHPIITPEK